MAEKPRLKESDEILNSIEKKRGRKKQPDIVQSDILPPPIIQAPQNESEDSQSGGGFSRTGNPAQEANERGAGTEQDNNPLDFSKYELPHTSKRRGRPRKTPLPPEPAAAQPELPAQPQAPIAAEKMPEQPAPEKTSRRGRPAKQAQRQPEILAGQPAEEPVLEGNRAVIQKGGDSQVREYNFDDFEERQKREERRRQAEEAERVRREADEARRKAHAEAEAARRETEQAQQKAQQAAEEARRRAEEAAELARREEEEVAKLARKQAEIEAELKRQEEEAQAERQRLEEDSRRKLAEDIGYREDVMDQLGNEFEQQFSQMFDGNREMSDEKPWWLEERREGLGKPVRRAPKLTLTPEEPEVEVTLEERRAEVMREAVHKTGQRPGPERTNVQSQPTPELPVLELPQQPEPQKEPVAASTAEQAGEEGADEFLKLFAEEVNNEERQREEDFRETLAQKFMRERERYLRDLGIAEQMEAEQQQVQQTEEPETPVSAVPAVGRKLDFQIRPEMHVPNGEAPPVRPVTYTRSAQVKAQTPEQVPPEIPVAAPRPAAVSPDGKKSAEQLLLELGQQTKQREARKANAEKPKQFHFKFLPVDDPKEADNAAGKTARSYMPRVVVASAAAALLIVALLALWITSSLDPLRNVQQGVNPSGVEVEELYTAYENYNPTTMRYYTDVVVKRSGITLSNLSIQSKLVVEEEASAEGSLTLNNVVVGDYIYINSSGVNRIDLRDVQAEKLVVKNDRQNVVIHASGLTNVDIVELYTPGIVEEGDMEEQAAGVRSVVLKNDMTTNLALTVDVKHTTLDSFNATGDSVVTFEETTVESMTADGSLNLSGSGRVEALSVGKGIREGAGDTLAVYPTNIQIKDVAVGQLTFKGLANVFLYAPVDVAYLSDPMVLGGNGTIANLIINEKFGNARLAVDISGLRIQQLTANAEAIIYSSGSSVINTLTANQSTYMLGNKVNLLVANANGVIYEREPDSIRVGQGVTAPQSREDNPNLDYSMNTMLQPPDRNENAGETILTTVCDHSQEEGGYLQGDGSVNDPYQVQTPMQLAHISQHLNSHFVQVSDIDIAAESQYSGGFPMIGAGGERFVGIYDGGGYAIRNLRIASNAESVGLFAENTGEIRNVNLVSGEISSGGKSFVGALVGMNYQGGLVRACSNGATVSAGGSNYAGGIVGYNYGGRVRDCYNTAKVVAGDAGGGIAGMNRQSGSLTNCYSIGVITAEGDQGDIVGVNEAVVANCFYLAGDDVVGIGYGDGNAIEKTRDQFTSELMAAELAAGDDQSPWQAGNGEYEFPSLARPSASVDTSPS